MIISRQQVASDFGYKMFKANCIDDLTVEQYNLLIELINYKAKRMQETDINYKRTTRIETVDGKNGINYGDD